MKKIIIGLSFVLLLSACGAQKDYEVPTFNSEVTFEESFPDKLTLSDGTVVKRIPDIFVLNFDTVPPINLIDEKLKKAQFALAPDGQTKQVNNSPTMLWVRNFTQGSLQSLIENLRQALPSMNWISPAYYFGSSPDSRKAFAPLPQTILIKQKLITKKLTNELTRIGLKPTDRQVTGYTVYQLEPNQYNIFSVSEFLRRMPEFQSKGSFFFENMPFNKPILTSPNDTFWPAQQTIFETIHVPSAWDLAGTNSVSVSVIDCGVNVTYTDISYLNTGMRMDNLSLNATPHPFSSRDHGTAISALVAAIRNNNQGTAGVSSASILPFALANNTDVEVAEAIWQSRKANVDIVNMSIGDYTWVVSVLDTAIESAHRAGILMIAASGNDGLTNELPMPAAHLKVMAVGGSNGSSHDPISNYAQFVIGSSWKGISVVAPSVGVTTVDYDGNSWTINGTSAACPLVTGVAALLKATNPSLTNVQIQEQIEQSAEKIGGPYASTTGFNSGSFNIALGYGRVNAEAALNQTIGRVETRVPTRLYTPKEDFDPEPPWKWWALVALGVLLIFVIIITIVKKMRKKTA